MDDCRPNVCLYLARLELRAGRPEVSERYVEEALELARSAGYPQVLGAAFGVRAHVAAYAGELDWARALLVESGERTRSVGDRWHTLHNRVTLGFLEASVGRYQETLEAVGSLAEDLDELGIAEPGDLPVRGRRDRGRRAARARSRRRAPDLPARIAPASTDAGGRSPWAAGCCSPRAVSSTPQPGGSRRRSDTTTRWPTRSRRGGRSSPRERC